MNTFGSFNPYKSRAIVPAYKAQWRDRVVTFGYDFSDWIVEGYPYSRADQRILGALNPPADAIVSESGDFLVTEEANNYMEVE